MRNHLMSLGIGLVMLLAGLLMWSLAGGVHTPVLSLPKIGMVLAVLGLIEVAITGVALVLPSSRHREYEL